MKKNEGKTNLHSLYEDIQSRETVREKDLKAGFSAIYEQNQSLLKSITYASMMQASVLPKPRHFNRLFQDTFVMYLPCSILSGDFYWLGRHEEYIFLAVADCTGHGVPAAMLSMLGISFLDYAVLNKGLLHPSVILQEIDKRIIEAFQYNSLTNNFNNDWIDISLCRFNLRTRECLYAGANRKVLLMNENGPQLYKGVRYPIGGWQIEKERSFDAHCFFLNEQDTLYLGSDGFQDQLGGPKTRKFGSKQLHALLETIWQLPFTEQKEILTQEHLSWKGGLAQNDDICMLGIKL